MGKVSDQQLPVVQPHGRRRGGDVGSGIFCCQGCNEGYQRISQGFNFKCLFVVLLGFAAFVYALLSVIHLQSRHQYGFDAPDYIKHHATIQAYFRLPNFSSRISDLEYEIFQEIGLPSTKVAILSMHKEATSDWTDVVFGVLSNSLNASISPAYLSLLRSTFLDIFQQQVNLTLTDHRAFGQPFSFEILKFPGGMTIIPDQSHPLQEIPDILFNFTLNNSITEIKTNSVSLKTQLREFLHLLSDETVSFQISNLIGSTRDPPVTVEALVSSGGGAFLSLDRLRVLAQIIMKHPHGNLGLDNTIFGKVKEVKLSAYLNQSLNPSPSLSPFPSLSPSPALDLAPAPDTVPSPAPAPAPAPAPVISQSPFSQYDQLAPTPSHDSDDFAVYDYTREISVTYKSYSDSTLPDPPSASASILRYDSLKDTVSLKGVSSSAMPKTPLYLVSVLPYITIWWIFLLVWTLQK